MVARTGSEAEPPPLLLRWLWGSWGPEDSPLVPCSPLPLFRTVVRLLGYRRLCTEPSSEGPLAFWSLLRPDELFPFPLPFGFDGTDLLLRLLDVSRCCKVSDERLMEDPGLLICWLERP